MCSRIFDSEESAVEEDGTIEPQIPPHSPNPSLTRHFAHWVSPTKLASGTSMNHIPMPPSYPKRENDGSVSSYFFSFHFNSKGSGSSGLGEMSPQDKIVDGILRWDTYNEFMEFCSKIGIMFNDISDAKRFLDIIRAQQCLLASNLDLENDCVELLRALHC